MQASFVPPMRGRELMTAAAERSLGDHRELRLQGVTTFVISLTSELQPELRRAAPGAVTHECSLPSRFGRPEAHMPARGRKLGISRYLCTAVAACRTGTTQVAHSLSTGRALSARTKSRIQSRPCRWGSARRLWFEAHAAGKSYKSGGVCTNADSDKASRRVREDRR